MGEMDSNIVFGAVGSIQTSQAHAANFFEGRRAEEWGTHESAAEVQQGLSNTKRGGRLGDSALVSTLPRRAASPLSFRGCTLHQVSV